MTEKKSGIQGITVGLRLGFSLTPRAAWGLSVAWGIISASLCMGTMQ